MLLSEGSGWYELEEIAKSSNETDPSIYLGVSSWTGESYILLCWTDKAGQAHRQDAPAINILDRQTGQQVGEQWCYEGDLHRSSGLPCTDWKLGFGEHVQEWAIFGFRHREDGPAVLHTYEGDGDGKQVIREAWYVDGNLHRTDGPALVQFADQGAHLEDVIFCQNGLPQTIAGWPSRVIPSDAGDRNDLLEWRRDGLLHRDDGPAELEYLRGGEADDKNFRPVFKASWYQDGVLGRNQSNRYEMDKSGVASFLAANWDEALSSAASYGPDGAAVQVFCAETGELLRQEWHRFGKLHRDDGPAIVHFRDSEETDLRYFRNGRKVTAIQRFLEDRSP